MNRTLPACTFAAALSLAASVLGAQARLQPLAYTIHVRTPAEKAFDVDVVVPTDRRDSIFMMMPVWSPGMYTLQSYGDRVTAISAKGPDGTALDVSRVSPSRWVVKTKKQPSVTVTYRVGAARGTNLSSGVTDTSLVIIGPATYMTLADSPDRPADVRLDVPAGWKPAATSLAAAPDGAKNHFVAPNYDVLADSPILDGTHVTVSGFTVAGVSHRWAYLGDSEWPADSAAAWVKPLVEEHARFWGALPLDNYVFLNIVTGAGPGSGVEHLNSVAINTNGKRPADIGWFRQAAFISHEYFHAMNVKRLRPVELGPFDYEHTAASGQMFERVPRDKSVDYYVKGPVVGLVLDANIRKTTNGKKSMDDVIRAEYRRWSGKRGFTAQDFAKTASDAAGIDLVPPLHELVASTGEVDYAEMLPYFGLRFSGGDDPKTAWTLQIRPDVSADQTAHLKELLARSEGAKR